MTRVIAFILLLMVCGCAKTEWVCKKEAPYWAESHYADYGGKQVYIPGRTFYDSDMVTVCKERKCK